MTRRSNDNTRMQGIEKCYSEMEMCCSMCKKPSFAALTKALHRVKGSLKQAERALQHLKRAQQHEKKSRATQKTKKMLCITWTHLVGRTAKDRHAKRSATRLELAGSKNRAATSIGSCKRGGRGGDGEGEGGEEGGRGLENKRKRSPGKMDTEEEDERKKGGNGVDGRGEMDRQGRDSLSESEHVRRGGGGQLK